MYPVVWSTMWDHVSFYNPSTFTRSLKWIPCVFPCVFPVWISLHREFVKSPQERTKTHREYWDTQGKLSVPCVSFFPVCLSFPCVSLFFPFVFLQIPCVCRENVTGNRIWDPGAGHLWHVPRWESQGFPRTGNKESQVMWECPKWEKLSVSRMTMRSKLLQGRISHMPLFMHKGNTKFSHLSQAGTCQRRPVMVS